MARNSINPKTVKAIRKEIDRMVKTHGLVPVRATWNRFLTMTRLQARMLKRKRELERELEKVRAKL